MNECVWKDFLENEFKQEYFRSLSAFLKEGLAKNPMKCEYYLPSVVTKLLVEDRATVTVLETTDKWYGVTYKEDKPLVMAAIQEMKDKGIYPEQVWE